MRYGSLCSGIGGLDLAVESVFADATPAWMCEADRKVTPVLERHWPGIRILPDLKAEEWSRVEPVDLVSAGYPCQPFSTAGKRRGDTDPRHLWPYVLAAVRILRPRLLCLENVAGHIGLGFDAVLADLATAGFDAEWATVRAADVGACHGRDRLFVVAADTMRGGNDPLMGGRGAASADTGTADRPRDSDRITADTEVERHARTGGARNDHRTGSANGDLDAADTERIGLQRFDLTRVGEGLAVSGGESFRAGAAAARRGTAADADSERSLGDTHAAQRREHDIAGGGGRGEPDRRGAAAADTDDTRRDPDRDGLRGWTSDTAGADVRDRRTKRSEVWGAYRSAVERHERAFGRPAPEPVDAVGRLSVAFVEWMQGFPAGWVDGLSRNAALRALGNACVPAQAAHAYRLLLERIA